MKQLIQNMRTGKTTVEDVPVPMPRRGQVLVRVAVSLVSAGTERSMVEFAEKSLLGKARARPDLVRQVLEKARREGVLPTIRAAFHRLDQPLAPGYSSAGVIVALGEGMEGFHIGQRVACAGGGYAVHAEYNVIPRNLLTPLPDEVDFEAAAFTTLGGIALHGFRLAHPQIGENVAVIGLGLLGLLTAQIATAAGCRVLGIEPDPQRLALAAALGLEACPRAQAEEVAAAFTAGRGFDVVMICAATDSNDPVELAGQIAADRGRVISTGVVGTGLPRKPYYEKELTFLISRSYGPGRYDPAYEENGQDYPYGYVRWTEGRNFQAVVELMAAGKLRVHPLITHRFPIERAVEAYELITGKKNEPFLGVLLTYPFEAPPSAGVVEFASPAPRPEETIRLGVIGAGNFATGILLPAIQTSKEGAPIGIASAGGLHAQQTARKFGFRYAASDEATLLNDPTINTIVIATRHDSHADLVLRALRAGKHVFVEKPLAIRSEDLTAIARQLQSSSTCLLTVGFNRRFAPLTQKLARAFEGRREPLYLHYRVNAGPLPLSHWLHDPQLGGGRILGEGCHFIDFLTFLVGAPPLTVSAHALPDGGQYRQDNVSMTFAFPDGSVGVVDYLANGDKSYPKERLEVFGGGRIAILDDFRTLTLVHQGKTRTFKQAQDKGWQAEWRAFAQAIRAGGPPPIPYEHLFGVTAATFAALESLRSDGMPIPVDRFLPKP
ncbi:MAG: bi-domain-containing oxidoreductase [Anaerolineales bacterium]|nr:bi-domain-containing oxidoreductase [Anaerolineales bacterium]